MGVYPSSGPPQQDKELETNLSDIRRTLHPTQVVPVKGGTITRFEFPAVDVYDLHVGKNPNRRVVLSGLPDKPGVYVALSSMAPAAYSGKAQDQYLSDRVPHSVASNLPGADRVVAVAAREGLGTWSKDLVGAVESLVIAHSPLLVNKKQPSLPDPNSPHAEHAKAIADVLIEYVAPYLSGAPRGNTAAELVKTTHVEPGHQALIDQMLDEQKATGEIAPQYQRAHWLVINATDFPWRKLELLTALCVTGSTILLEYETPWATIARDLRERGEVRLSFSCQKGPLDGPKDEILGNNPYIVVDGVEYKDWP